MVLLKSRKKHQSNNNIIQIRDKNDTVHTDSDNIMNDAYIGFAIRYCGMLVNIFQEMISIPICPIFIVKR